MDTHLPLTELSKYEPTAQGNPRGLKVLAGFQIVGGIIAVFDITIALRYGRIYPDLSVLGLYAGPALLRHSQVWRSWILFWLCIAMLVLPVQALRMYASPIPLQFTFFGIKVFYASKIVGWIILLCAIAICIWELRILTCHEVRVLFGLSDASTSQGVESSWHSLPACMIILAIWVLSWGLAAYSAIRTFHSPF